MSVRISAGRFRGRRLRVPRGVRPTEGRVREALFDRLQDRVAQSRVLDLFAGSGAVGVEALSRGAASLVSVDRSPTVVRELKRWGREQAIDEMTVVRAELPGWAPGGRLEAAGFDLVFADPPYAFERWTEILQLAESVLASTGWIVLEHRSGEVLPDGAPGLTPVATKRYGESSLTFYASASAEESR